jgi:osmoprotectant transport system substrate-binding protein
VYNAAPMVRIPTLDANPSIRDPLDTMSKELTTDQMRKLNKRVAIDKVNPQTVAKEYLTEIGLI